MISRQHRTIRAQQREVSRGLDGLGGLVDHGDREPPPFQRTRLDSGERREHDLRLLQHRELRAIFQLPRLGEELPRFPLPGAGLGESARTAPLLALAGVRPKPQRLVHQLRRDLRLRMCLRLLIERVLEHAGKDAGGMSDADVAEDGSSSIATRPSVAQSGGDSSKAIPMRARWRLATMPVGASSAASRFGITRTMAPTPSCCPASSLPPGRAYVTRERPARPDSSIASTSGSASPRRTRSVKGTCAKRSVSAARSLSSSAPSRSRCCSRSKEFRYYCHMATIERHVTNVLVALDALTPCREAAKVMRDKKIGSVAVREAGRVVGIITERDLVARVLAAGDNGAMPIGEAMRTDLPRVPPTTSEAEAAELMRTNYTRHLLVEETGRVVGIISMRDVIQVMLDDKQFLIEQLQTYIDGR